MTPRNDRTGFEEDLLHTPLVIEATNPKRLFKCDRQDTWSYCRAWDGRQLRFIGRGSNIPAYVRKKLVWKQGIAELKQPRRKLCHKQT